MKSVLLTLLATVLLARSFAGNPLMTLSSDLENVTESSWINTSTIVSGSAYSGSKFSTTDSLSQFGFGYKSEFPESCLSKNLTVRFSEQIRSSLMGKEFGIVASVSFGDSTVFWKFWNKSPRIKTADTWTSISDEISVPKSLTGKGYLLSIYLWNKDGQSRVDIDDFEIRFEEMQLPTYLPASKKLKSRAEKYERKVDLKNAVLWLNQSDGGAYIENLNEDTIFSSIVLITEISKKKKVSTDWKIKWKPIQDSASLSNGIVKLSSKNSVSRSTLSIDAGSTNKISFSLTTIFEKNTTISRLALSLGYSWNLKAVYKNGISENENFSNEYWLGKEGVALEKGNNEMILYDQQMISSLQLNVADKKMIVNADYCGDHPMLHFPLMKKSLGRYEDYSPSEYKRNDTVRCEFTFYIVSGALIVPALLSSPYGFPATFVWTEHADYTDLRTHRAVYFGSDSILRSDSATAGFVKYSIPVTKSVFYTNPQPVDNSEKAGFLKGPEATVTGTDGFNNFLKQLDESGMEICLHTPDHYSTDRKLLDEALSGMRREFASVSWIDHGYDNGMESNREDLNCDGANPASNYYAADLWKKYGIKYLWNSFYEDSGLYAPYAFNSFFTVPYSGWAQAMPVPQYWRHDTRTGGLIHWRTSNTLDLPDGSLWSYLFNDLRLEDLVNSRGTVVVHCYPARVDSTTGFYDIKDNIIVANEGFNEALRKLSQYRSEGKIRLSTVKEMLDYRTSLEYISYEFLDGGIVRLQNNGDAVIRGVTFSAGASEIKSSKKEVKQKQMNDQLIFWVDIEAGETIDFLLK